MRYPIIKLPDGLIAVDREAEIKVGDILPLDYGGFGTVMEGESNFYNNRKSRYPIIIAASPSLNLGVVELPEVGYSEQSIKHAIEFARAQTTHHHYFLYSPEEILKLVTPVPSSVEIEGGKFIKYNY